MSTGQAKRAAEQWMDTTDQIDWKSRESFTSRELSLAFLAGTEWMREQCAAIIGEYAGWVDGILHAPTNTPVSTEDMVEHIRTGVFSGHG